MITTSNTMTATSSVAPMQGQSAPRGGPWPGRHPSLRATTLALALLASAGTLSLGCEPPDGEVGTSEDPALRARNGLPAIGIVNPQTALGAKPELVATAEGRSVLQYLVKCALPAGRSIVQTAANGTKYTYQGSMGFAPEWETGSCTQGCQEWVSACMLALINATGANVPVLLMAEHPSVGFGQQREYPYQEGAFFGNIFAPAPVPAYYCGGRDLTNKAVPGRIGSRQVSSVYTNKYGDGGLCAFKCTPSDYPRVGDGYKACSGWNRVVTVWRADGQVGNTGSGGYDR